MKIISVGRKTSLELKDAVLGYSRRLLGRFQVEWVFVPNSNQKGDLARSDEAKATLSLLRSSDFVILLDERGKNITSPALAELIHDKLGQQIVFIIGGAYGVDADVRRRANFIWGLSNLVFPHQIVRLILTEQIYRAQTILSNHPYHHQ